MTMKVIHMTHLTYPFPKRWGDDICELLFPTQTSNIYHNKKKTFTIFFQHGLKYHTMSDRNIANRKGAINKTNLIGQISASNNTIAPLDQ